MKTREGGFAPIAQLLLPPGRGWDTGAATRTEMLANARLMAAAPDLLQACVQVQPSLVDYACRLAAEGNPHAASISALLDKLEAAIITARGEASR